MEKTAIFRIEAVCRDPGCEGMNLYLSITPYSRAGKLLTIHHTDVLSMRCGETYSVDTREGVMSVSVSVYVIPAQYPTSDQVSDALPFDLSLRIYCNETLIDTQSVRINCWGGAQIIDKHYP